MENQRLERQLAFCREMDKEKLIGRQTYLADGSRKENDAEHAWHMALMALLLAEHANQPVDLLRVVAMLLVHDLVEVDAGDTFAYDAAAAVGKEERERAAADRIFAILPPDQGAYLRGLWDEFEACTTPEAKFAHTMDNFQPAMLNDASDGKSWVEHGVALSQILRRNARTAEGSRVLWDYSRQHFIQPHVDAGHIKDE